MVELALERAREGSSFVRRILQEGRVVYDRSRALCGSVIDLVVRSLAYSAGSA